MHLTRVSGASAHETTQAIATGGDGDLLALLLGGGGEASPAFPLTLEAALAGGERAGDPLAEASDEAQAAATDATALTIDAALAAALALASAVAVDPSAVPTRAEGDAGDAAAVGDAIVASAAATLEAATAVLPSAVDAEAAAAEAADPTAAADAAIAATAAATSSDEQAAAVDADAAGSTAAIEKPTHQAETATSARPVVTVPEHGRAARLAATTERSANDTGSAHGITADAAARGRYAEDTDAAPSFDHHEDGDEKHGDFARPTAATPVETPAKLTLTVTAPGAAGETTHATRTDVVDPATAASVQTTTTNGNTTTATHANAPARAEHTPLAHGTIEARWSERVSDAVRLSALRGGGEIRLQLEPEGLGHIDVRLDLHADGVRAVIVAEHESTRALLQSQQQTLHDAFGRSDLRLSGFSVDVGSGGAAAFQRGTDGGEGGQAPAAPASAPATTTSIDAADAATSPAGNGRVNVRV
jgi:flagellar hook-length control protein FliK